MVETVVGFVGNRVAVLLTVRLGNGVVAVAVAEPLGSVAARAVAARKVAALNHEVVNDTMEDGAVVVAVLNEEFEVLDVNRSQIGVQLDGDRTAVRAAVPGQVKLDDVGGGVASVGDVDHRQDKHASEENGHNAGGRWRAIVEQAREAGFADAFVLHLVEKFIVEAVRLLVAGVFLGGFSQQRSGSSVIATVVSRLGFQPCCMACKAKCGGLFSVGVDVPKNLQGRIAFSFRDGLLSLVPTGRHRVVRHATSQPPCGFEPFAQAN